MNSRTGTARKARINWRIASLLIVGVGLTLLIVANVHLVYVAIKSQPSCVPHEKMHVEGGPFRAARSAC
jgi:type IV secretory pathway TrbF-like protein